MRFLPNCDGTPASSRSSPSAAPSELRIAYGARRSQEEPGGVKGSQGEPGTARRGSQEGEPGGARKGQEEELRTTRRSRGGPRAREGQEEPELEGERARRSQRFIGGQGGAKEGQEEPDLAFSPCASFTAKNLSRSARQLPGIFSKESSQSEGIRGVPLLLPRCGSDACLLQAVTRTVVKRKASLNI